MDPRSNYDPPATRYIETRVSLMWLLGVASSVIVTIAGGAAWLGSTYTRAAEQMDRVAAAVKQLERNSESRTAHLSAIAGEISNLRSRVEVHESRLGTVERDLVDIRRKVNQ